MNLFYDLIILLLLFLFILPAVILLYHRRNQPESWEGRHRKKSLLIILLLFLATTTILYGSFVEPKMLVINEQTIDLPQIEEPIRIIFFSDVHLGPYKQSEYLKKIVDKIIKLEPDLVLIGGDIIGNDGANGLKELEYILPIKKLTEKYPTYAINGNHEYGLNMNSLKKGPIFMYPNLSRETEEKMTALGVKYLTNDLEKITIRDQSFYLFGGDEYWAGRLDPNNLNNRIESISTIALIHNQSAIAVLEKYQINLMLAGHTHGGQIRLPFIGPIGIVDDVTPRAWYKGLINLGQNYLFVSSGVGETGTRARLFNPPEIVLLTIN